jgi:hypothetical protein
MGNASSVNDFNDVMYATDDISVDDKEELLMVQRYTNELKLNRYTKDQVKDKIHKFMTIYENPNRRFDILKNFLIQLN